MSPALFVFSVRLGLAALFLFTGVRLLTADEAVLADYHLDSYPIWFAQTLGVVQIVAGLALPLRRLTPYAVALLFPIMTGAVWTILQAEKRTAESDVYLPMLAGALLVAVVITPYRGRAPKRPVQAPLQRPRGPAMPVRRARQAERPERRLGPYEQPSGSLPIRGPTHNG